MFINKCMPFIQYFQAQQISIVIRIESSQLQFFNCLQRNHSIYRNKCTHTTTLIVIYVINILMHTILLLILLGVRYD